MYVAQAITAWRDGGGGQVTQFITTKDQTAAVLGDFATVLAAQAAMSDAGCVGTWISRYLASGTEPQSGPYATARDRAQFIFNAASGALVRVNVPSPKAAIFLTDSQQVDLDRQDVQDFIAAVQLACAATDGSAILGIHSAQRIRVRAGVIPF